MPGVTGSTAKRMPRSSHVGHRGQGLLQRADQCGQVAVVDAAGAQLAGELGQGGGPLGAARGLAASKTPDPTVARLRSLRAHAIYGAGLYLTGQALNRLRGLG